MKTILLKISFIFLFLSLMGAGCEKEDELLWEISPDSETAVIQKEVDGIEFKFCLLNEKGEPATVFNEGENFTFQFEFRNLTENEIKFSSSFINDDFFKVKNNDIDFGKPWQSIFCEYVSLPEYFILKKFETNILQINWVVAGNNTSGIYPFCPANQKEILHKGNYYTQFELNFEYKSNDESKSINGIKFKINFEIK